MCIIRRLLIIGVGLLLSQQAHAVPSLPIPMVKPTQEAFEKLAPVPHLILSDVIAQTIKTNPYLRSLAQEVDLARENIDLARANYRPNVSATAGVNHLQSNNDLQKKWTGSTSKTVGVQAVQPLYRGGRTVADVKAQTELAKATEWTYRGDVDDIIIAAVRAYMDVYQAYKNVEVNKDNRERLNARRKAAQAEYDVGQLTRTDTSQAEARYAQAEAEYSLSQAKYDVALSSFRKVTGVAGDIRVTYPDFDQSVIPETLDEALIIAEQKNPQLRAAQKTQAARNYAVDVEKGAFLPEVDLQAAVDATRDPVGAPLIDHQEQASVSVNMTIPIYQSGIIRNQVRQAKIVRAQADAQEEAARRAVVDSVVSAWENYRAVDAQIKAREAQVEASKIAQEGVNLEQTVGARSVLDVLDVNQDVRDAELALIEAKSAAVVNYYQLLVAMGLGNVNYTEKER